MRAYYGLDRSQQASVSPEAWFGYGLSGAIALICIVAIYFLDRNSPHSFWSAVFHRKSGSAQKS